jgi:hypothetical protein
MNASFKYTLAALVGAFVAGSATHYAMRSGAVEHPVSLASVPVRTASSETIPAVEAVTRTEVNPELERLRRENEDLSARLADALAREATHVATLKETQGELEELRRPMNADTLSSTLRAELKSGEVVVTGGYKLPDGRRLYAFAKPNVEQIDGTNVVMIEGRYLTVSDEAGKAVGLDSLATNAANTLQHGEVWVPEEEATVLGRLANAPGTQIVQYPGLSVRPGRSGTISVGDIQLKVTPTLAEDGDGVGMELRLEQPQQTAEAAP